MPSGVTIQINTTRTLNGVVYSQNPMLLTANAQTEQYPEVGISAAAGGTLTTRTNTTQGTITLTGGHGLSTGTFDMFWNTTPGVSGGQLGSRTGVSCTITVNACVITGGSGDDIPTTLLNAAVSIKAKESYSLSVLTGDNAVFDLVWTQFLASAGYGYIIFTQSDDTLITTYRVSGTNPSLGWDGANIQTNPFAGVAVAKIKFSHGELSTQYMGGAIGYD